MRRRILMVLAALTLAAAGWVGFFGPGWLAARAGARLVRRLERLGLSGELGGIDLTWSGVLHVGDLKIRDPEHASLTLNVSDLRVELGHISILARSAALRAVRARGVDLDVRDPARLQSLIEQIRGAHAAPSGPTRAAGFTLRTRPLPPVMIEEASLHIAGAALRGCEGRLEPAGLVADTAKVKLDGTCAYEVAGRTGKLSLAARVNLDAPSPEFIVDLEPPLELRRAGRRVSLRGLARDLEGRVSLTGATLEAGGLVAEVERIDLGFAHGLDPMRLALRAFKGEVGATVLLDALAEMELQDVVIRGTRPGALANRVRGGIDRLLRAAGLDRAAPGGDEDEEAEEELRPEPRKRRRRPKVPYIRTLLVEIFQKLEGRYDRALELPETIFQSLPLHVVRIRRARLVDSESSDEPGTALLNHADAEITRTEEGLSLEASFHAPMIGSATNHLDLRVGGAGSQTLTAELVLTRFPLGRYAAFAPERIKVGPEGALRDLSLLLSLDGGNGKASLEASLGLHDLSLDVPGIAPEPVHFEDLGLGFKVDYDARAAHLTVRDGAVDLGAAHFDWSLDLADARDTPKVRFAVGLSPVKAQALFEAIPDALVPIIRDARFEGTVSAELSLAFDTSNMKKLTLDFKPHGEGFRIASLGKKIDLDTLKRPFVHRIVTDKGSVRILVGAGPDSVPWDRIPKNLVKAILTTEDATFMEHHGFAGFAIRQSLVRNLVEGRFARGASTVTQQMVKNLFLSHAKTIARKLQEVVITHALEQTLTKERILEIYFNIIEWGPDLYGLAPAARTYFGKLPEDLDLVDCLFLVSLIPAPRRYVEQFERGEITEAWRKRLEHYARKMLERHHITREEFEQARPFKPVFRGQNILDTLPIPADAPTRPEEP